MAEKRSLNLMIIEHNLDEAIEELKKLKKEATEGTIQLSRFQVGLLHAYHHLNFAWNARYATTEAYQRLTQAQFKRWGRYPKRIENI
ncbi:hypothetical protein DYQ86_13240 [Acidobacteria bacterium AB60]|nr:hypothetical protein DYQ86_13240 [Acidobacteria bacterium AB60]